MVFLRAIFERNREFLIKGCNKSNLPKLMNVEMQLRKCCNHPWLIPGAVDREVSENATNDEYFAKTIEVTKGLNGKYTFFFFLQ